jgi:DNA-binding winged helix-turn-helix (wHTH) protein
VLEHSGEVVSREELRARLWPADTFVDFDNGLNNAVVRSPSEHCGTQRERDDA